MSKRKYTHIVQPVSVMCKFFEVSRSGYYDYVKRMDQPEHDAQLAEKLRCVRIRPTTHTVIDGFGNGLGIEI